MRETTDDIVMRREEITLEVVHVSESGLVSSGSLPTYGEGGERRERELGNYKASGFCSAAKGRTIPLLCFLEPILHHWIMGLMMIMDMQRVLIE